MALQETGAALAKVQILTLSALHCLGVRQEYGKRGVRALACLIKVIVHRNRGYQTAVVFNQNSICAVT